jgi:AcrR family transcriptional regulator
LTGFYKVKKPTRQGSVRGKTKRERVVAAATRLFLEEGYGTTGMDAIAKAADVSKATLYSYYEDKASLFADVMLQVCDAAGGHDMSGLGCASPDETLRAVAVFGVERVLDVFDRTLIQRVVAEAREFPELGRRFWETGPEKLEQFVAGYLADARARGVLEVDDPVRSAARFVGLVTGMYLLPMLVGVRPRPSEKEMRQDLDVVVAGFLAPLRPRAGRRS